ncbi:MAG: hypothetical protein WCI73_02970 [Phycisphaerae bacterium]
MMSPSTAPAIASRAFTTTWQHPKAVLATADGRVTIGSNNWSGGLEQWRRNAQGDYELVWSHNPGRVRGLTALSDGRICATIKEGALQANEYKVHVYERDGRLLNKWGEFGEKPGQFCNPAGICFDARDRLYILDTTEWNGSRAMYCNRVQIFTSEGRFLHSWGETGKEPGQFNLPVGITVAPDQTVWVADSYNCRIQHFTADGCLLASWGGLGSKPGFFNAPQGLVTRPDGTLLVIDTYNNRLQCLNQEDGAPIWSWGKRGTDSVSCWLPCAVALDSNGRILITDTMNRRILMLGDKDESA